LNHVILEGPDGAGKTTLAEFLRQRGYAYRHEGPPPGDGGSLLDYYTRRLLEAEAPTVFDRLHVGEVVYGPLLRGQSRLTALELTLLHRVVSSLGAQMVLCMPSWETCLANTNNRKELLSFGQLERAYAAWMRVLPMFRHVYSYESISKRQMADVLVKPRPTCPLGVTGSPYAKVLFVGERVNAKLTRLDLPFHTAANSSGFFHGCLKDAGFNEVDLAFTNAFDLNGQPRNLAAIAAGLLDLQTIVALGTVAFDQCEQQLGTSPFDYCSLFHPAYWKRFHAGDRDTYVLQLRSIARSLVRSPQVTGGR